MFKLKFGQTVIFFTYSTKTISWLHRIPSSVFLWIQIIYLCFTNWASSVWLRLFVVLFALTKTICISLQTAPWWRKPTSAKPLNEEQPEAEGKLLCDRFKGCKSSALLLSSVLSSQIIGRQVIYSFLNTNNHFFFWQILEITFCNCAAIFINLMVICMGSNLFAQVSIRILVNNANIRSLIHGIHGSS